MDYWATSRAEEEARSPFPLPSPSDGTCRQYPADPARGRRRLDIDAAGRPVAWADATGVALDFGHDDGGNLRRISSGAWFVAIEGQRRRRTFAVTDPAGRTEMQIARGGRIRTIERGADRVSIELDQTERVRRVELPGSINALAYEWDDEGECVIRAEGGGPLLQLSATGAARRIALDTETWLEEEITPGRVKLRAAIGGAVCDTLELELANLVAIAARRWPDGSGDHVERDDLGRLSARKRFDGKGGVEEQCWRYDGADLVENEQGRRTPGEGGRVLALDRADGAHIAYRYDAAGRRIARAGPDGETHYHYDPLGTLCGVETPDGRTARYETDGMGRRVAVRHDGAVRHEHRDEIGRLWAVTDACGRAVHTYVWIGDRIAARIDGAIGAPVAEAYLCDPLGTPNGALVACGEGWRFERIDAPPFGRADDPARPTLYGHFGDPATGLIHFGARDLDPELGLFLNPDPWHGGADDPRRWAGTTDAMLANEAERAAADWHDYALCRFDPLGRYDRDGHVSFGDVVLHIVRWILLPTWGFPLTAISLFFFQPFNFYMEIVGLIVWAFKQLCEDKSHPWGYHTIAKATLLLGSTRQFTFALGLNGFLPRVVSGRSLNADRAVTVGNVIWINREELSILARPEVVELDDIGGGPAGAKLNDDPTRRSVVALLCSDDKGRQRLHVAGWTRAPGNAVQARVTPAGPIDSFFDKPAAAGGSAQGAIHLRHPIPLDIDVPSESDDDEKIEVLEFTLAAGVAPTKLETLPETWFALKVPKDTGFAKGDWLRITAPKAPDPKPDPVFREIRDVQPAADHAALILSSVLADLQAKNLGAGLQIEAVKPADTATPSPDWATGGAATTLVHTTPAPPAVATAPDISADAILRIVATTPTAAGVPGVPGGPASVPEDTRFTAINILRARLTLEPDRAGAAAGTKLVRMSAGATFAGVVAKTTELGKIKLTAPFPTIAKDDLLVVSRTGTPPAYVRAKAAPAAGVLQIDPALPAAMVPADATRLDLRKAAPLGKDADAAEVAATPGAGADIDAKVPRGTFFEVDNLVRIDIAGGAVLRRIAAVPQLEVDVVEAPVGTGPFTLTRATAVADRTRKDVELAPADRFLKWTGGPAPGGFGAWPGKLLAIQLEGGEAHKIENAVYYAQWPGGARPAGLAPEFRNSWTIANEGADQFVVLEAPLPLIRRKDDEGNMKRWWRIQPDDYEGRTDLEVAAGIVKLDATEYSAGATRADQAGRRVLAHEPEVLVPEDPTVHDTHRRALIEHEIHHTVQCNFWGPIMTALPVSGLVMSVTDMVAAAGVELPDWLQPGGGPIPENEELNWFQIFSIGGIMQLFWKYVFLLPFLGSDDLRDKITDWDFNDLNKVFNPVSRLITEQLPQVDPNAPAGTRWLEVLGQMLSRALDLRSWTPGLGFVPTLLPDGPTNFIEQGASRASGDLYSTILTANDRYNLHTRGRLFGSNTDLSANLQCGLGKPVRLLTFCGGRNDRTLPPSSADIPGMAPVYRETYLMLDPFTITVAASVPPPAPPPAVPPSVALFPAALYSVTSPAGVARAPIQIEGPPPARTPSPFLEAATNDIATPLPRAFVPLPPRVNRSMGFYLIPGGHCKMTVRSSGYHRDATIEIGGTAAAGDTLTIIIASTALAGSPITIGPLALAAGKTAADVALQAAIAINSNATISTAKIFAGRDDTKIVLNAREAFDPVQWTANATGAITATVKAAHTVEESPLTETVVLTFSDEVKLGDEVIAWAMPAVVGATPATTIKRFQLEENELRIRSPQGTKDANLGEVGIKDFTLDILDATVKSTPLTGDNGWKVVMPAAVPAAPTRLRLFRTITKTDSAFDLTFPDVATIKDVRSYLDGDIFVVVRDVMLLVEPLPEILPQSTPWDTPFELKLPIRLAQGDRGITITPPLGVAAPPVKRIGDDGRGEKWAIGPMPEPPGDDAKFKVDVTYGRPDNKLVKSFEQTVKASIKVTGASFDVLPGTPLELDLAGGTGAHTVKLEPELPGLEATQPAGKIRLLASAAPDAVTDVKVTVTDSSAPTKMGVRHVSVKNMPPILMPNTSTEYFDYIRPATLGLAKPLINGRSSGGAGPNVDLTEPLDAMENAVKALGAGDIVYLSAWFFEPATTLTAGGIAGVTTWGELFVKKARDDVKIRLLINDFDPISGMDTWLQNTDLTPLNALIAAMPAGKRDNLKYLVCLHPAHVGKLKAALAGQGFKNIYVASHHQKFMVVRKGTELTGFCGGLDIESRKTPVKWSDAGMAGWHDLHVQLEGPIAYDLEREFVDRWNRSKDESTRPALAGWAAMETLTQTALSPADDVPAKKTHVMQLTRTVSDDGATSPYTTKRNDVSEMYRRAIQGAKQFLYLENQYFRSPALADWIIAAGKANPALVVIMVVVASAAADDGRNAITDHGDHLQFDTFDRIQKALGARAAFYTMTNRAVHSKFMLVDDVWMTIGSANANVRSFELDSEVNIGIGDPALTKAFRARLWAHNLGEAEATVAGWGIADFIAKWNGVAVSNRGKAVPDMVGEGVVPYDHSATPGVGHGSIPDALADLDFGRDNGIAEPDQIA